MVQKVVALLLLVFVLAGNFSCGKEERTEPKSRTNSPPVISSLNISPEKPTEDSELNSVVQGHDPDGDPVTYQYQWLRNDEEIIGENKNSLKSGNFKKEELIQLRVTPFDGKINGPPFLSAPVKILNSPPVIQEAWIEPKAAYVTDRLKVNVKNSDPDGDLIYYTYQWDRNGMVLNEESGEVLEQARFKKGDSIAVTVTPDDRESLGKPKRSDHIIILNSPPIFVSSPPTSAEGTKYAYQVKTNDPDNDPVYFALKANPKGMEINKNTGLIQWEIRKEDKGNHAVEIEVSDDAGAKSIQRFTLTIDFK
jgi:hypothetical protein